MGAVVVGHSNRPAVLAKLDIRHIGMLGFFIADRNRNHLVLSSGNILEDVAPFDIERPHRFKIGFPLRQIFMLGLRIALRKSDEFLTALHEVCQDAFHVIGPIVQQIIVPPVDG